MARLACCLATIRFATSGIYRHDLVDGEVREVSCESLEDCYEKGIMTPGMMLHRMWAREIDEKLQRREAKLNELQNASALLAKQMQVRRILRRMLGAGDPQKSPNTRLVRQFKDEPRGVMVQMLLFETWKGQAVPAVIFIPLGLYNSSAQLPAVLHLPGHLAGGLRDPEEQRLSLGLAQRGFVVMSFDPISQGERTQYGEHGADIECRLEHLQSSTDGAEPCPSVGPPCSTAHNHFGQQLWLLGLGAQDLFVRDAQRALDVLTELPFVNASRIAVVGCSGGGALSAYLGAVDPRVTAVAVACYFSTLGRELEIGTCNYDAEQILWKMATYGIDKPDLLRARAPKPAAVILTSHDCFPILGGREGFVEVETAFRAHGDGSGLCASEAPGYHQVTDTGWEAIRLFFDEELQPEWRPAVLDERPLPCSALWFSERELRAGVTPESGWRDASVPGRVAAMSRRPRQRLRALRRRAQAGVRLRSLGASSWLGSLPQVSAHLVHLSSGSIKEVREAAALSEMPWASQTIEQPSLVVARTQYFDLGKQETYVLYTSSSCAVTLRLFEHRESPAREAGIVVLVFGGAADLNRDLTKQEEALLNILHDHGFGNVVFAGLCGAGDQFWRGGLWQFAPLLLGKSHVGYHASEVLATVSWAFRQLRCQRVVVLARGSSSAAVLHAAPYVPHLEAVVLLQAVAELADVARVRKHRMPWPMQIHGVLKRYDLPDLVAALPASVAVAVTNPLGGKRQHLSWIQAWRSYGLAARRLRGGMRVILGPHEHTCFQIARFLANRLLRGANA